MHCTLNPNPGFRPFHPHTHAHPQHAHAHHHMDSTMQFQQRDFHGLNNLPMQLYNNMATQQQNHDYWNYHSSTMRPDNYSLAQVVPIPDSPPLTIAEGPVVVAPTTTSPDFNNHSQYRESAEKEMMITIDPYYALSNESNGSGSSSSPPVPSDVNYYYMSPTDMSINNSSNSNSTSNGTPAVLVNNGMINSMDSRSNSGSSSTSNLDNYHRPMYEHSSHSSTKNSINSGGNSLDLLTKQVNQYEPIQIVPISALLDDDDFEYLLDEFQTSYRRGSTCSTASGSLSFSRRSSSADHFDSFRHRTSPPSPSNSPPALLIDATNYCNSSSNYVTRMQTPEFRHPEMDSELGRTRSPDHDHPTNRRHSFGATAAIAELAKLKIAANRASIPDSIGENVSTDDQQQQQVGGQLQIHLQNHSIYSPNSVGSPLGLGFAASDRLSHKRHSIPNLHLSPFSGLNSLAQAASAIENHQRHEPQFTRRRESISSLSDHGHNSHDELGPVSSPESVDVNRQRRDSDASVKIIENDPGSFLFLGPCGKKRRIIRERKMSEPSEDPDAQPQRSAETRRSSLGDTRYNVPLRIRVKQEPADASSDEASDIVRPLNLCIIEETRNALERVRNLNLSESLAPPLSYYEERRKSTSSIESLPPLLAGGLRALALSGQQGLEGGSLLYRQDRRFSEPIVSSRVEKPEKKKLKCPDCPKEFSQLRNFRYHRSKHEGTETFACTCPVCGKHFNDKGYLSSHLKIHRNAKEYHCEWCPKSFNQRVAYNMHIRIHTGLKPHQCTMCPKSFSRKMLLRQHLRTHTGERPYQCDVCNKCFADRSNMLLHKRLHSGERPYKCQECSKTFSKNHHLKTHMNHHAGIKPYQCEKCKACFSQSSNMKTHFRKCTGVAAPGAVTTTSPTGASPNPNASILPKASSGRSPKQGSPRSQKGAATGSGSPDHISVIAHTSAGSEFLYGNAMNRRQSNPCLGQRNFYESHQQGQRQSSTQQMEELGQFRKHSASFSGPSSSYMRHPNLAQLYQMNQDPRFHAAAANNGIDLNSTIQFSLSRIESSPLARFSSPARSPIHLQQRTSPPTINEHPPPPPSPTGDILRNSLLNKAPPQYPFRKPGQRSQSHSPVAKDA